MGGVSGERGVGVKNMQLTNCIPEAEPKLSDPEISVPPDFKCVNSMFLCLCLCLFFKKLKIPIKTS